MQISGACFPSQRSEATVALTSEFFRIHTVIAQRARITGATDTSPRRPCQCTTSVCSHRLFLRRRRRCFRLLHRSLADCTYLCPGNVRRPTQAPAAQRMFSTMNSYNFTLLDTSSPFLYLPAQDGPIDTSWNASFSESNDSTWLPQTRRRSK